MAVFQAQQQAFPEFVSRARRWIVRMCMKYYILGSLASLLAIGVYYETFVWFCGRYLAADSYYSHGFLIPLVSGFLIWMKRKDLRSFSSEYSSGGLWILSFALLLRMIGSFIHFYFISGISLFLFIHISHPVSHEDICCQSVIRNY